MGDLLDRYGVKLPAKKPDLLDRYGVTLPEAPADMPANASGVQDWEPIQTRHIDGAELPNDKVAGWATTQIKNIATGVLGSPRGAHDTVKVLGDKIGLPPSVTDTILWMNPVTRGAGSMPTQKDLNEAIEPVLPTVSTGGRVGKVVDAGIQAAGTGLVMGGGASSIIPSMVGGATSEAGGQLAEGTPWEPAVRLLGGLFGGGVTAFGQNALGTIWQGLKNLKPNTDEAVAKIIQKAAERDKTTVEDIVARQRALGEGATFAEAGGPNVRGAVRGSITAPGQARTNVANAFEERINQVNDQTTASLNKNITPLNSLAGTVDELNTIRRQQASPLYRESGIPNEIKATETTTFAPLRTKEVPEYPYMKNGPKKVVEEFGPPAPIVEKTFNSPNFSSPKLDYLLKNSDDMQAAIGAARRLPDYKDLPQNSMIMLDKAYKHLNAMEYEAKRAGNLERARDIGKVRTDLKDALIEVNPKYGEALAAYEAPSKLITAAERGKEWFSKNVDPVTVKREFGAMTPDEQQASLIGVRDWARDVAGRSDRGIVAERVWTSENNRQRFQALLDTPGFESLSTQMDTAKNTVRTTRDIGLPNGSRTPPMLSEQADNALQMGPLVTLGQGRPVAAGGQVLQNLLARVTEGRNEAVNARLAEIAMMTDPNKVGMVAAMANKAKLEAAARAGDRSAAYIGAGTPMFNLLTGR